MAKAIRINNKIQNPAMIFTDRDNPRRVFWDAYDSLDKEEFYVINYYGFGGIGKSWLCKYLNGILRSGKHPNKDQDLFSKSIVLNLEDLKHNCDKVSVLEKMANKFENECNFKFPLFKFGLYVYYRTMGKSNNSPEIECIQDNVLIESGLEILQHVPIVGAIGSSLIKCADSLNAARKELVLKNREEIQKLDSLSTEEIANELVDIFTGELCECTEKEAGPTVVFLDTYEQLQNYVYVTGSAKVSEDWLWSGRGLIRQVSNVLWVLAGQRKVTWAEKDAFWNDENTIIYEEIEEIDDRTLLTKMLEDIGIKEEDIRNIIVDKTHGVPLHLSLCKDTYFGLLREEKTPAVSDFDMEYSELAERFIGGLNPELQWIAHTLACLENWNNEDAEKLGLLEGSNEDRYKYVLQLSFISAENGIYYMHNTVQETIYRNCSENIQKRCLVYFEEKIKDMSVTTVARKEYIYKKIKLQLNMIGTALNSEDADAVIGESLKYIREYLYDYNFFVRARKLIIEKTPDICLKDEYKRILNIYSLYHSVIGGEFPTARSYIEDGKTISGHKELDDDAKGFLYVSMAYYENHMKNYSSARNYFLEAYRLREESDDVYAFLDLMYGMGMACYRLKKYLEALEYSDKGIEKVKEMIADGINLDTKGAVSYCALIINKAKVERSCGNINKALEYLEQAEDVLRQFDHIENESIYYKWATIFQEYMYVYRDVDREDLRKEYALKILDVSEKACELTPSFLNKRGLAIAYRDTAKVVPVEERKGWFDKSIEIMEELYKIQPNSATYNEMFMAIGQAVDWLPGDSRIEYIDKARALLENESENKIGWTENYVFQRAVLLHHYKNKEYDIAFEKMQDLDNMVEQRKDRLTEQKYLAYKSWQYQVTGNLYAGLDQTYKAIYYYERENSIEKRLYKDFPDYADGTSYADSCRILALAYAEKNLSGKAVAYAKKQIVIEKAFLDAFQSPKTMQRYIRALGILTDMYEQSHKTDDALAVYDEILKYAKKLYDMEKSANMLLRIFKTLNKIEKYKIARKQYDQIENEYESMLTELADYKEKQDWSEYERFVFEYLKLALGRIWYIQRRQLDKALEYIQSLNSDNMWFDKWFYTGKIESVLFDDPRSRVYLTKEEGLKLLKDDMTNDSEF